MAQIIGRERKLERANCQALVSKRRAGRSRAAGIFHFPRSSLLLARFPSDSPPTRSSLRRCSLPAARGMGTRTLGGVINSESWGRDHPNAKSMVAPKAELPWQLSPKAFRKNARLHTPSRFCSSCSTCYATPCQGKGLSQSFSFFFGAGLLLHGLGKTPTSATGTCRGLRITP